jgi:hypothetical protein
MKILIKGYGREKSLGYTALEQIVPKSKVVEEAKYLAESSKEVHGSNWAAIPMMMMMMIIIIIMKG